MCHAILLGFGVQSLTVLWIHSGAEIDACVLFTEQGKTVAVQLHISAAVSASATATVPSHAGNLSWRLQDATLQQTTDTMYSDENRMTVCVRDEHLYVCAGHISAA